MKNLFLRMMALAIISTLIITGCGAVNAAPKQQPADTATTAATVEQAQPVDTATTTATAEQAQSVDTATTTATAEQAQPADTATTTATAEQATVADTAGEDSVIIVFDDGVEVVAVKEGDVYRCTSSNGHTFKYEGEEIAPGRYSISDEAVKSWAGLLLFDRKVNGW